MIKYVLFQQIVKLLFYFLKMFYVEFRDFYIKIFDFKHKVVILLQSEETVFLNVII